MPELPEVETLVKQLEKRVIGKRIVKVDLIDSDVVDSKIKNIGNRLIVNVKRRAKSIIIELEKDFLLVHLRMTGHFHYIPKDSELRDYEKFIVAKFELNDGSLLTHNSIRKFGSIRLMNKEQLEQELSKLGPEPLSEKFTLDKFKDILSKKSKANIKTTLMDQKFISGVGNIYAMEALYWAGINPQRKIGSLSEKGYNELYKQLRRVLNLAIERKGSTVDNYAHIEGTGGFQKLLAVYGRERCPKRHSLKKISIGGRGTYYCSKCQS